MGLDLQSAKNSTSEFGLQCQQFYSDLLDKPVIKIDYFVGYSNFDYGVVDSFEREAIRQFLMEPCPTNAIRENCGFQPGKNDANLLTKNVVWPDGRQKTIEFRISNPSISWNDARNRADKFQKVKSQNTQLEFVQALAKSDLIIYSGHSRYGGGPDFFPEVMGQNGKPDVLGYRKARSGVKDLLAGLGKRNSHRLALVALLSCDSLKHFDSALRSSPGRPKMAMLTTEKFLDWETFPVVIELTNAFTRGQCLEEIHDKMKIRSY